MRPRPQYAPPPGATSHFGSGHFYPACLRQAPGEGRRLSCWQTATISLHGGDASLGHFAAVKGLKLKEPGVK